MIECHTIRLVVTSAAEAETHGVFTNAQQVVHIFHLLQSIGHDQSSPTRIRTDNSTTMGFVNKNMQMKKSKLWDMKLHWLRDPTNKNFLMFFMTNVLIMEVITSLNITLQFTIVILNAHKNMCKMLQQN